MNRRRFIKTILGGTGALAITQVLQGCRSAGLFRPTPTALPSPTLAPTSTPSPDPTASPTPTASLTQTPAETAAQTKPANTITPAAAATPARLMTRLTVIAGSKVGDCDSRLWANLGYDPIASTTLAPESQPAWQLIRSSSAFRYIRCHNTFSDAAPGTLAEKTFGCRVYTEDNAGNPVYNFKTLDEVLDIWLKAGLRPILEMDFMPDALADGPVVRNYGGGAINAPRDLARWRELVYQTVRHLIDRYGAPEVRNWYFEIWNEPELKAYFIDGFEQNEGVTDAKLVRFNQMYDYFVAGATAADPQIKVGGPGLAFRGDFLKLFLEHITQGTNAATGETGTRTDFISWHVYGYPDYIKNQNQKFRKQVRSYPALAKAELLVDEWGIGLANDDSGDLPKNFTEWSAAFLCRSLDLNYLNPDAQVDLFLRWGTPSQGWRGLTRVVDGMAIPWAIFNAYVILARLGSERLEMTNEPVVKIPASTGISGIATRQVVAGGAPGAIQVLVYRYEQNDPESQAKINRTELEIQGLGALQAVTVGIYRIDRFHANAYRALEKLGLPQTLSSADLEQVLLASQLQRESGDSLPEVDGVVNMSIDLLPNAVALLEFEPA